MPRMDYWDFHPDEQTAETMLARIAVFKKVETRSLPPSLPIPRPAVPPIP
jgi:hypothetical protein